MRIGISLTTALFGYKARAVAQMIIERCAAAADAGLDSLFVGDHHSTSPLSYFQNVPILGRILAEWDTRPAGALFLLPLWHPVLLAEQIGTLAAIHKGPFILQCAVGPDDRQFPALGVPVNQRPSRFEQSLEIMRRLWDGEKVSSDGRWTFKDAEISPVPEESISVWIGANSSVALDRAARISDGWLGSPGLTLKQASAFSAEYAEKCVAYGKSRETVAIRRDVYVGKNDEEAMETTAPVLNKGYRGIDPSALAIGDPKTVADEFQKLAEVGYTDVIVRNIVQDQRSALESIKRLAEVRERLLDV